MGTSSLRRYSFRSAASCIIPSIVVTKKKFTPDGQFSKWKFRQTAGGHRQYQPSDTENSAPTVDPCSFFTLLSVASQRRMGMKTIDFTGAFLIPDLPDPNQYMKFNLEQTKALVNMYPEFQSFVRATDGHLYVRLTHSLFWAFARLLVSGI